MGPGVSRPMLKYWGILGLCGRCEGLRGLQIIYPKFPFDFVRVGLMCLFAGDVASRGTSDSMAMIKTSRSREPESTRSRINARGYCEPSMSLMKSNGCD